MRNTLYTSLAAGAVLLMFSGQVGAVDQWPATGQTTCYDAAGTVIACGSSVYPNQDADSAANDPVNGQVVGSGAEAGTVLDNVTGLQWVQDGASSGSITHTAAQTYVGTLTTAGHSDWRLPTAQELSSLVDSGYTYDEAGTYGNFTLPETYTRFWASNPDLATPADPNDYMVVHMRNGTVNGSSIGPVTTAYVLAVRNINGTSTSVYTDTDTPTGTVFDETTGLMWQQASARTTAATIPPGSHQLFWGAATGCDGDLDGDGLPTREDNALCYCDELELGGFTDWRLPDRSEMHSLIDYSQSGGTLIDPLFPDTAANTDIYYYWTSTTVNGDTTRGWGSNFAYGYIIQNTKATTRSWVRCVRGRLYKIDSSAVGPGTITTSDAEEGNYGGSVAYTITPNMGESIVDVVVDGESQGAVTSYTFPATTAGQHSIVATFATTYEITVTNGTGCTIDPAGPTVVVGENGNQSFTIGAIDNYSVTDVLVDSVSQGVVTTYDFTNVTADHTIETVCTEDSRYTLTVTVTGSGRVTSEPIGIDCSADATCNSDYYDGTEVMLTATADDGRNFLGWSGDCSGTADCTVTMGQEMNVGAEFDTAPAEPEGNTLILYQPAINNAATKE